MAVAEIGPDPVSVWNVGATLGEGPVWVRRDRALWFTDIKRRKIHRYDPASGEGRSWDAPEQIGFVYPAARGGFIVGLQSGLYHFNEAAGDFTLVATIDLHPAGNRLNDATTDSAGRLWFGTMDDNEQSSSGAFFKFEAGRVTPTGIADVAITNGPAMSPDGRVLYHVDTRSGLINACDVVDDGTLANSRPFVRITPEEGYPDGPTVDSEGCVWIALFAGWQARRYSSTGELLQTVRFPVANITKLAFGGDDLRTVYATTARLSLTPADIERQPEAGDLFAFRADVPGLEQAPVAY
ncbi:MAG: Xylonolactonase [uncultured Sphingomonadaceae bacterium]|uniref:Xylonolactonase n=1 Tax=uncultured Sphingomonadaceae bacterium TaxID=169976 RepID=A0A6J4U4F4_9SPHN|nr:MAG: Xylonolactonase [uncultured Sphingomonadaceae bacterium]